MTAKLERALADFADDGLAGKSAWQRLSPVDLGGDAALLAIERALDEPATAALLADLAARGEYPAPVLDRLHALGLASFFAEEEGAAAPPVSFWRLSALNALAARRDGSLAITIGVSGLALLPAYIAATPAQLQRIFARVRGGARAAMLLTELEHGSNLLRNRARAEKLEGGAFRLTGEKDLINGGARHELLMAFMRTRESANSAEAGPLAARGDFTLFLVERDASVEALPRWRTLPAQGADIGGVRFRGTIAPEGSAIGGEGEGFAVIQKTLSVSRGGIGALASGAVSRARDLALRYARRRDVYGAPIAALGAIREHLLRIEALDLAAAAIALKATAAVNALGLGAAHYTAAAKLAACALAEEAVAEGRRVLAARALLEALPYARLARDVLLYGVFDGTSHLMLDQLQWRLAQQSVATELRREQERVGRHPSPEGEGGGDCVSELRRIYATPPRPLVEALRARAKASLLPLEPHAAAFGAVPLARALLGAVRALRAASRWDEDQALRFEAGDIFGHLEALLALAELAAPAGRAALGLAPAPEVPAAAAEFAIGFLGARLAARVRDLALRAGTDPEAGEAGFVEMRERARAPLAARLFGA